MFSRVFCRSINASGVIPTTLVNNFKGNQSLLLRSFSTYNQQQGNNNSGNSSNGGYRGFIGALTVGVLTCATATAYLASSESQDTGKEQTLREKVITNYQNRIREYSTPEKIFETFASVKKNGQRYMTMDDFVRAILPHQFKGASDKGTKSARVLSPNAKLPLSFKMADVDGDGLISFSEFVFFSTLLSIPQESATIAFKIIDVNHDNAIDVNEFSKILSILRTQSNLASTSTTTQPIIAQGWVDHLFGKNGKKTLSVEQFQSLLDQLHRDVLLLEFNVYDQQGTGVISQRDFGTLIVNYANSNKVDSYTSSINSLPNTVDAKNKGITFDQFVAFNGLLDKLDEVGLSIDLYKGINQSFTKSKFKYVSKIIGKFDPSQEILDTIYTIFDLDRNGDLEKDEFVSVMKRRKYRGLNTTRDTGFMTKLKKIYQIIIGDK